MNNLAFIETSAIENLRVYGGPESAELIEKLVMHFESTTPKLMEKMKNALQRGAYEELSQTAHTLKSSCYNLGAVYLGSCCQTIEMDIIEQKLSDIEVLQKQLHQFENAYSATLNELKTIIRRS